MSVAKHAFAGKRKMLSNSLSGGLGIAVTDARKMLESAGIDPKRRAETLTLEEWLALAGKKSEGHF